MKFSQLEKNIITVLGEQGAMGVATLMPKVQGLTSKTQLKGALEDLADKHIVKYQQNGQWVITKNQFKTLKNTGALDNAAKPLKPPVQKTEPESLKPEVKPLDPTLLLGPETCQASWVTLDGPDDKGQYTIVPDNADDSEQEESDAAEERLSPFAEELLFSMMCQLPKGAQLLINDRQVSVDWLGYRYEPALDELSDVLTAIDTLQQHAAGAEYAR